MNEQETLLQRYLDGEAGPEEMRQAEALIAADPELAEFVGASREVGEALGGIMHAQAEALSFDALWAGVEKDINWYDAGRARALSASAEQVGVTEADTGWGSAFRRWMGWRVLGVAAAVAAAVLVVPRFVEQLTLPENGGGAVGPVAVVAQIPKLRFDGVEVESVEASANATVMVFQGGEGEATFIWVDEMDPANEGQAI